MANICKFIANICKYFKEIRNKKRENMKLFIPELDAAELKEHGFNKNDIFQRKVT